jgi:mannose-6-phosphate isomerase-like protein (cupin superfamily)
MLIRRVVTGHTSKGKAIIASDTRVQGATTVLRPGMEMHSLWGADEAPSFPDDGSIPSFLSFFPPVGGFRFGVYTVPPATEVNLANIDMESAKAEMDEKWPGLAAHMEPDNPGMHRTHTIDFEYIASGEVWLELDDGEEVHLGAGDTVIQNGTRHAWRNKSSEPCRMVFCLIGAECF